MDKIKEEPVDEEELISIIEIEEHFIKAEPSCTDARENTLEQPQFVICSPEQDYTDEASDNGTKSTPTVTSPSIQSNEVKLISCTGCSKKFNCQSLLDYHIKIYHQFQCTQCDKVFSSKTGLLNHLQSHFNPCQLCSEIFQTQIQLKQHEVSMHGVLIAENTTITNFECSYCNEKFFTKSAFELHRTPNLGCETKSPFCSLKPNIEFEPSDTKRISCEQCNEKFRTQLQLFRHSSTAHGRHQFQCTKCDKVFKTMPELRSHMICDFHPIPCEMCSENFTTSFQLKQHSIEKHGVVVNKSVMKILNFECVNCNEKFPSKSAFDLHKTANFGDMFKCSKCDSFFKTDVLLCFHHKSVHTQPVKYDISGIELAEVTKTSNNAMQTFYCYWCPEKFTSNSQLLSHVTSHTKVQYQCQFCDKKYPTKFTLKCHIKTKHWHLQHKPIFKCDFCLKQYMSKKNLESHIKSNHLDMKNICKLCKKSFSSVYGLRTHENIIHNMKDTQFVIIAQKTRKVTPFVRYNGKIQPVLECDFCSKKLIRRWDLQNHIQTRHLGKKYSCKICSKTYSSKYIRKRHEKSHLVSKLIPKEFHCDLCSIQYRSKNSLRNHINVEHFGMKFVCQVCEKSFSSLYHLKNHESNSHTGKHESQVKLFDCNFCPRKYKTKKYLVNHVNVEHLGKKWCCQLCNESFASRYLLKSHEICVHD